MTPEPAIVWFREDLRLSDNPALRDALASAGSVICLFIDETGSDQPRPRGGASAWWLHHSIEALGEDIAKRGGKLLLLRGSAVHLLPKLAKASGAKSVHFARRYDAKGRAVDQAVAAALKDQGQDVVGAGGKLLVEPSQVTSKSGTPFRVYSPFWRAVLAGKEPDAALAKPSKISAADLSKIKMTSDLAPLDLADLKLLPTRPDWAAGLRAAWTPGEAGAHKRLASFLDGPLESYADDRNRPDWDSTSALSPFLAFGEISPRQIWHAAKHKAAAHPSKQHGVDKFLSEIGWREFSYHLLFHNPDLATKNFAERFDAFPWQEPDLALLKAWQTGQTGYPIVDAGMRELWITGWMHNRVRMIVASFLIKHLMTDWRRGEEWFWDTLCDADPANNAASWQWVAGSGADAAPYFRVFNPVLQGEKFDPSGVYVRRYVPELRAIPDKYLHRPWDARAADLAEAGVRLGEHYPKPLIDHDKARARALAAFAQLKEA